MPDSNSFLKRWSTDSGRLRIHNKDRILFAKRLALYLHAGITILESLRLIHATAGSRSHARLLQLLIRDVQEGLSLSQSLAKFPLVYTQTSVQIIAVGERSGTLSRSLAYLASILEARAARTRLLIGALAYPTLLLIGSTGVSIFLVLYAFPKIIPLFRGLHATLPFATRALLSASLFLQNHWLATLNSFVVLSISLSMLTRLPWCRHRVDKFMLQLPFIGILLRTAIVASIFRTISTLLISGIRLDEAISMARDGISNQVYRISLNRIRTTILNGSRLSIALEAEQKLFPLVTLQLASVGEMTGTLSESMTSMAHILENELSERIHILSTLLEPLIMVVMGLIVGFIAMAIIAPMYGITQSLTI